MRRSLKTAIAVMAFAVAIPGAALAHDASHHSAASHQRHHRHHAHHVRFVAGSFKARKTTTATHVTPTTVTTTTTHETPGEAVGTVQSFEGGVLKIVLADGSVVSGKVTEMTRLECGAQQEDQDGQDGQGGNHDSGDDNPNRGPGSSHGDDEHGGLMQSIEPECTVAALVAGAKVEEAELTLTGAGAVWEKVSLTK